MIYRTYAYIILYDPRKDEKKIIRVEKESALLAISFLRIIIII